MPLGIGINRQESMLCLKRAWGDSKFLIKSPGKIIRIAETNCKGDLRNIHLRVFKQLFRLLKPK